MTPSTPRQWITELYRITKQDRPLSYSGFIRLLQRLMHHGWLRPAEMQEELDWFNQLTDEK